MSSRESQPPSVEPTDSRNAQRFGSVASRFEGGRDVFVKQYRVGSWDSNPEIARQRTAREADIIRRIAAEGELGDRLGIVNLVSANPDELCIVTEKVAGTSLEDYLMGPFRRRVSSECLWAMYLAGRWLWRFQQLPALPGDEVRFSENDPTDLVEYCRLRLKKMVDAGEPWATPETCLKLEQRLAALTAQAGPPSSMQAWCHGDFNPANMIWDGRKLTAIDFAMAKLDHPLVDVAGFIHRLEMLPVYYPWRRWPVGAWKVAFLWGYGEPDCEKNPMFKALAIRHLVCRLLNFRKRRESFKRRCHSAWIRRQVRARLSAAIATP